MWRPATDADSAERRTLWIWTHPSCHDEVFAELSGAFSLSESDCRTYPVAGSGSFGKTDVVQKEVEANGSAALKRSLLADNVKDVSREAKRQKLQEERVDCDITSANHVETGNSDCRETSNIRSDVVPCTEIVKSEAVQAITALPVGNRKNRKKLTKSGKKASKTDVAVPLVSKMALTRKVFDNGVVSLESLKDDLCRFRLIGPTSHSILSEALSLIDSENILPVSTSEETKENVTVDFQWWKEYYRNDGRQSEFHDQEDCWKMSVKQQSATDFPMHCILSLIVRDPRLFLPVKRTHASLMTLGKSS
jgi:hypothetical protein